MKRNKSTRSAVLKNQRWTKAQATGQKKSVFGKEVEEEFIRFREFHPARRLSTNLRTMLIEFLMFEGAIEADYLQDLLYDLQGLFDLLEAIQLEGEALENNLNS